MDDAKKYAKYLEGTRREMDTLQARLEKLEGNAQVAAELSGQDTDQVARVQSMRARVAELELDLRAKEAALLLNSPNFERIIDEGVLALGPDVASPSGEVRGDGPASLQGRGGVGG